MITLCRDCVVILLTVAFEEFRLPDFGCVEGEGFVSSREVQLQALGSGHTTFWGALALQLLPSSLGLFRIQMK